MMKKDGTGRTDCPESRFAPGRVRWLAERVRALALPTAWAFALVVQVLPVDRVRAQEVRSPDPDADLGSSRT